MTQVVCPACGSMTEAADEIWSSTVRLVDLPLNRLVTLTTPLRKKIQVRRTGEGIYAIQPCTDFPRGKSVRFLSVLKFELELL